MLSHYCQSHATVLSMLFFMFILAIEEMLHNISAVQTNKTDTEVVKFAIGDKDLDGNSNSSLEGEIIMTIWVSPDHRPIVHETDLAKKL